MADELVNGTQGHENESVNVAGLKATIKDAGNLGIFNKGTCSTAASTAAKTVTVGSAFSLVEDSTILIKFANGITAENATLSVNSSAAKPIYYHGAPLEAGVVKADSEYLMRYDGTYWVITGGMADLEGVAMLGDFDPAETGQYPTFDSFLNTVHTTAQNLTDSEKAQARTNIGVPAATDVYTKAQIDAKRAPVYDPSTKGVTFPATAAFAYDPTTKGVTISV